MNDPSAISKATEEFFGQIVTIFMKKSEDNDTAILNEVDIKYNCNVKNIVV